jgi:hypothetical protein
MSLESRPAYQRLAWVIPFGVGVLMLLSTLFIVLSGANPPAQFEVDTDVMWSVFKSDYPSVAQLVSLLELLVGIGYFTIGAFTVVIAATTFREGKSWAWVLWILPAVLGFAAVLFFTHDQAYVGYYYVGLALLSPVGLILPVRRFFPRGS